MKLYKMSNKHIFVVGLTGSGKTYISTLFEKLGVPIIHVGLQVKKNLELDPANFELIEEITKKDPYFVSKVLSESTEYIEETVIFEGAKSLNDLYHFTERPQIYSVYSPRKKRLERILRRARYKDVTDIEGLIKRDKREISYGARDLILAGDVKLENCWSDELIHLLRLEQLVGECNHNLTEVIARYLKKNYSTARIEWGKQEMQRNEEMAKKERYWIDELNI